MVKRELMIPCIMVRISTRLFRPRLYLAQQPNPKRKYLDRSLSLLPRKPRANIRMIFGCLKTNRLGNF